MQTNGKASLPVAGLGTGCLGYVLASFVGAAILFGESWKPAEIPLFFATAWFWAFPMLPASLVAIAGSLVVGVRAPELSMRFGWIPFVVAGATLGAVTGLVMWAFGGDVELIPAFATSGAITSIWLRFAGTWRRAS